MNIRLKTGSISLSALAVAALASLAAVPAAAEIYRCNNGETTVFSDTLCAGNPQVYRPRANISVIGKAEGLDEIAASNRAFVEQRQEALAQQRERAAEHRREARLQERRRAAAEEAARFRNVIGHLGDRGFGADRGRQVDARTRARAGRQSGQGGDDASGQRRTLLSRSGGNRPIIRP